MNPQLNSLADRIQTELPEIERALQRATEGWERVRRTSDDYYLDGVALNLHDFYSGFERIFERISSIVDGSRPTGENWHQSLLEQMTQEKPTVRPAVLSESTRTALDEYRGFRHVVRNVYTFRFDPQKIEKLVHNAYPLYERVRSELLAFADFLETRG